MALKGFRRPPQKEPETQALAQAVADFTRQLEINPMLDGRILASIEIGITATDIVHGLNRPFRGWMITRRDSAADIYESAQLNMSQFITLIASSAATVDIYIF